MKSNRWARTLGLALIFTGVHGLSAGGAHAQTARRALNNPQPDYPEIAKKMHLNGTVRVEVVIGANGQIKETKVIGGHPLLVNSTLMALKMWKFAPSNEESTTVLEFNFASKQN
jgi:TonB family protein